MSVASRVAQEEIPLRRALLVTVLTWMLWSHSGYAFRPETSRWATVAAYGSEAQCEAAARAYVDGIQARASRVVGQRFERLSDGWYSAAQGGNTWSERLFCSPSPYPPRWRPLPPRYRY